MFMLTIHGIHDGGKIVGKVHPEASGTNTGRPRIVMTVCKFSEAWYSSFERRSQEAQAEGCMNIVHDRLIDMDHL